MVAASIIVENCKYGDENMKQLAGAIRIGWVIEYKGKPWTITKAVHIKPGKGGAFMQVEMKEV